MWYVLWAVCDICYSYIHIETNPHNGLQSNLLKKTMITSTSYFAAEEENVCIRKKR